jgi:hypothetical protein
VKARCSEIRWFDDFYLKFTPSKIILAFFSWHGIYILGLQKCLCVRFTCNYLLSIIVSLFWLHKTHKDWQWCPSEGEIFHKFCFYFIILSFTYMCIHCLSHLLPHLPVPPFASWQNLFHPFLIWFCWIENVRKTKLHLLVWNKDSYRKRFLAWLTCTCVLQPILVRLYQTSWILPGPLPIMTSATLRLLYSFLYSEHINHIQVLGFFPFPILPACVLPFCVTHVQ